MIKKASTFLLLLVMVLGFQTNLANAAMSWQPQTSGITTETIESISFATKDIGLACAYVNAPSVYGILKRTTDGGTTWEDAGTAPTYADGTISDCKVSTYYNSSDGKVYAAVNFHNSYASYYGEYYTTNDLVNVVDWTLHETGMDMHQIIGIKQIDSDNVYTSGSTTGMTTSAIFLNTTMLGNTDSLSGTLTDIDCTDSTHCWSIVSTTIAYTSDGLGFTGGAISGLTETLNGIDMVNSSLGYLVGDAGTVYKCNSNNCATENDWSSVASGITEDLYDISCIDSNTCWAVGTQGNIYKTTNGATSWTSETSGTTETLFSVSAYDASNIWTSGETGTILVQRDSTAPTTTASPASGTYTSAQTVTLTATDADSGVAATYYTTDGTDPTTSSTEYSSPITISETTTLKFFSVDNAENSEAVKTEIYTISTTPTPTPTPAPTPFDYKIKLKNATLDTTYHSTLSNTDLVFYRLPKRGAITDLYVKLTRNKKGYNSNFIKKLSYPGHVTLTSNIGLVDKDYYKNIDKHIKFKVAIRYSQNKINKLNLKEGKLRLYYKTETGIWKGPYTVYQNKDNNVIKFKIRNYLLTDDTADIASANRTYSPTFYFKDLTKIKFIIAEKGALNQLQKRIIME